MNREELINSLRERVAELEDWKSDAVTLIEKLRADQCGVVMPTVDKAMLIVLREMGGSRHIRGTSNWRADVGRAVLDEVASLNLHKIVKQSVVVPEGWALVPVDLTESMREAFSRIDYMRYSPNNRQLFKGKHSWAAILSAAPKCEDKA